MTADSVKPISNRAVSYTHLSSDETRAVWPYDFALRTTFSLEGRRVRHAVSVRNTGKETLRFGLGFHPGFTLPFDDKHTDCLLYTSYFPSKQ